MKPAPLIAPALLALLLTAGTPAQAQKVTYVLADYSTPALIDKAAAEAVWHQHLPEARLAKVYPSKRYGFLSQVTGGIADGGTCVVSARAVMLPRTSPTRRLVWEPAKSSTVIGAQAGASAAQCSELAGKKLTEAVQSLASSLVK